LLKDPNDGILVQLASKKPAGSPIYITRHTQATAMASLLRSYFAYHSDAPNDRNNIYKTYRDSRPKPGNEHHARDVERRLSISGCAFRVSSCVDWVRQEPSTLEFPCDINTPSPLTGLADPRLTPIFTVLKPLVDNARNNIVAHARHRLQPKAVALAQRVAVAP